MTTPNTAALATLTEIKKVLDPYVEEDVTKKALQSRIGDVENALYKSDWRANLAFITSELQASAAMATSLAGSAQKRMASLSLGQVVKYAQDQIAIAKSEDGPAATVRLAHLAKVVGVAKGSFDGDPEKAPVPIEFESAYAPEPETAQDLTTKLDQTSTDGDVVREAPSADGPGQYAANAAAVQKRAFGVANPANLAPVEWPGDVNFVDEGEKKDHLAAVAKRARRAEPAPETETAAELWGRDAAAGV